MVDTGMSFLDLDFLFSLFKLFLLLNDSHEQFAFLLGFLKEDPLLVLEVISACLVEVFDHFVFLFLFQLFLESDVSVVFLHSSSCSDGVDLSLSISHLLLLFSELLDFAFSLLSLGLFISQSFELLSVSVLLILDNRQVQFFFFSSPLCQDKLVLRVDGIDLLGKYFLLFEFLSLLFFFLFSLPNDLHLHHILLSLHNFLLHLALQVSLSDLVHNLESSSPACLDLLLFPVLLDLEGLESFDLHHQVKFLLFFDVLLFEPFVFFKLLVPNGDDFGVEDHSVHGFYFVDLFVQLFLGLGQDAVTLEVVNLGHISHWFHFGSLAVQINHLLLS